jgi:mannose-6-phosphate isomerase-like protein (cupin superfamily)
MKHLRTNKRAGKFDVLASTRTAQAAVMVLKPGDTSDQSISNEHPRSEQWLLVVYSAGRATTARSGKPRSVRLGPGSLLFIERNELHQIVDTGRTPLRTINLYAPPAYDAEGNLRVRAKQ